MKVISLQSGSNGNCLYVETGETRLLFDAGISASLAAERLASHGRDIKDVDALIISHDHGDHVRHAGVYHRKFGLQVILLTFIIRHIIKLNRRPVRLIDRFCKTSGC